MNTNDTSTVSIRLAGSLNGRPLRPGNIDSDLLMRQIANMKALIGAQSSIPIGIHKGSFVLKTLVSNTCATTLWGYLTILGNGASDGVPPMAASAYAGIRQDVNSSDCEYDINVGGYGRISLRKGEEPLVEPENAIKNKLLLLSTVIEGEIVDAGGKNANIHIVTTRGDTLTVGIDKEKLADLSENILYKRRSVRVSYKYDPVTGEQREHKFLEFVTPKQVSIDRLGQLIAQETPAWKGIPDIEAWVRELRGGDEA